MFETANCTSFSAEGAAIEKLIANGSLVRILDESSTTQGV